MTSVSAKKGSAQLRHTQGTLSILSTTKSLPRAVGLANPTGVEDLGIAGFVGGTKNGLMSNALGKRLSVRSVFTGRGVGSFALKLFKWKFSTLALQTAHCMSFSLAIYAPSLTRGCPPSFLMPSSTATGSELRPTLRLQVVKLAST